MSRKGRKAQTKRTSGFFDPPTFINCLCILYLIEARLLRKPPVIERLALG